MKALKVIVVILSIALAAVFAAGLYMILTDKHTEIEQDTKTPEKEKRTGYLQTIHDYNQAAINLQDLLNQ